MEKRAARLTAVIVGVFVSLLLVRYLNSRVLPFVPLAPRMALLVAAQWILLVAPLAMMRREGISPEAIGFVRGHIPLQIGVGLGLAMGMSLVLTVLPILLGGKDFIGSTPYTHAWQFLFDIGYKIFGVALAEEIVFRGYLFYALRGIRNSFGFAAGVSSALFGLFHLWGGSLPQVVMTGLIGLLLCLCRKKIPHCSLLSLIIAHGVYDGLITLWVWLL